MIRQELNITVKGKKWHVTAFYPVTRYHVNEIMHTLRDLGCDGYSLKRAYMNLATGQVNNGLTFSNFFSRESVVVFAISTSPEQYFNLIVHELHHLSVHVAVANGLDLEGEETCYINGDIAQMMFPTIKRLICDCHDKDIDVKLEKHAT